MIHHLKTADAGAMTDWRRQTCSLPSKCETSGGGIPVKHPDGIERQFFKVLASEFDEFFQNVVRHRNDVTTAGSSLKNVKHLTDACPEKFSFRDIAYYINRLPYNWQRINSRIGDSPRQHRNDSWNTRIQHGSNRSYLMRR